MTEEPILKENKDRFVLFPIQKNDIWQFYKRAEASFWTAEEIDLSQDLKDWANLNDGERHFIKGSQEELGNFLYPRFSIQSWYLTALSQRCGQFGSYQFYILYLFFIFNLNSLFWA